jgi:antitoxin HicB
MRDLAHYLSLHYRMQIKQDGDAFVAWIPDLDGCVTQGDTMEEALQMLQEARELWLETAHSSGIDIPEPRDTEDFSGRILLRMPRYLHARLSGQADDEGVSLNQYIVSLLSSKTSVKEAPAPRKKQYLLAE